MVRRGVPVVAVLCAVAALSAGCTRPAADRPNVIVLVMDTTRADRCSTYGYERPTTPSLSALAAEGALFRNAWSPSPWTGPAHASLFTGLRPEHHRFLSGPMREYLGETPTLATWFRTAGYRTACFSNSPFVSRDFGLDQGFEVDSRDFEDGSRPYPYAPATHERALAWAERCRDAGERFFLFVNDIEPHSMYTPPEPFETAFMPPAITDAERKWGRTLPSLPLAWHTLGVAKIAPDRLDVLSHLYDGEVACLDREVGRFVDRLRRSGLLDQSVLVVLGDHGENLGEHGRLEHNASLHRTVLHVPLVIRHPPSFPAGTVEDDLVRVEDIAPTLLGMCGLPEPDTMDGESLIGVTGGRMAIAIYYPINAIVEMMSADHPREVLSSGFARRIQSVYDGRWHYILYSDGEQELYDVKADPEEVSNLAADHAEVVAELEKLLPIPQRPAGLAGAEPVR